MKKFKLIVAWMILATFGTTLIIGCCLSLELLKVVGCLLIGVLLGWAITTVDENN